MANYQPDTWPATPWIIGDGREADCIYQEGELTPLILVDPSRVMPEEEANATLTCECPAPLDPDALREMRVERRRMECEFPMRDEP